MIGLRKGLNQEALVDGFTKDYTIIWPYLLVDLFKSGSHQMGSSAGGRAPPGIPSHVGQAFIPYRATFSSSHTSEGRIYRNHGKTPLELLFFASLFRTPPVSDFLSRQKGFRPPTKRNGSRIKSLESNVLFLISQTGDLCLIVLSRGEQMGKTS